MKFLLVIILSTSVFVTKNEGLNSSGEKFSPKESTFYYKLGDRPIPIKLLQYGELKDIVMINLHSDETTSVDASQKVLESTGGLLIKVENRNKRNIQFRLENRIYSFDPNRIFTREGIVQSLNQNGRISPRAIDEVERFASRILQFIPESTSCIIALHNNTNGNYSIDSYLPGRERENDAKLVYKNSSQDEDDHFLTTDSILFTQLSSKRYNVIWQNNETASDDGSLSVYCGKKGIRYLNCETEHGKYDQYCEMLMAAYNVLLDIDEK